MAFFGSFEHSLDAKGRVILPARFRSSFDTVAFLAKHHEGCLALWTPDEFQKKLAEMEAAQERGARERNVARVWAAGSAELELDRQGRVAIPAVLREYARLESAVLVTGALNRIELWNPADWEERVSPAQSALMDPEDSETGAVPAAAAPDGG